MNQKQACEISHEIHIGFKKNLEGALGREESGSNPVHNEGKNKINCNEPKRAPLPVNGWSTRLSGGKGRESGVWVWGMCEGWGCTTRRGGVSFTTVQT